MSSRDRCRARVPVRTLALVAIIAAFVLAFNILAILIEILESKSPVHPLVMIANVIVSAAVGVVIGAREARKRVAALRKCISGQQRW
jgi:hypothetical protein